MTSLNPQAMPMRVLQTPSVSHAAPDLAAQRPTEASLLTLPSTPWAFMGPAIVVVTPRDLVGPRQKELAALSSAMRPSRMVLLGGTRDKDTLIQSINVWRVARVIPEDTSAADIWAVLGDVYESLLVSTAVETTADELVRENEELEVAIADLERAQQHLLHTERLSTVGRIAQGLITSIRHHLGALDDFAVVARDCCDDDTRDYLDLAFDATRSVSALLEEMQGYTESSVEPSRTTDVQLNDLIERVVSLTRFDTLSKQRQVSVELGPEQLVSVERYRVYQVLLNLLRNAFQATNPGDRIVLRTYQSGTDAVVEVEDEGCGMPPQVRERIFEPFFSTKGDHGMGLGLHICRLAIERQSGRIECDSVPNRGTCFRVVLPRRLPRAAYG